MAARRIDPDLFLNADALCRPAGSGLADQVPDRDVDRAHCADVLTFATGLRLWRYMRSQMRSRRTGSRRGSSEQDCSMISFDPAGMSGP
jgi:hypothetical protein